MLAFLAAAVVVVPIPAAAQSAESQQALRTPDGQPHISGIFTFRTLTPLQRPARARGTGDVEQGGGGAVRGLRAHSIEP